MSNPVFKRESGADLEARLKREFRSDIDPRLRAILYELDDWSMQHQHSHITITCLLRTPAENKSVNGHKFSAHIGLQNRWVRAADLRTWYSDDEQVQEVIDHLYDVWGYELLYIKYHDAGSGKHLHLNIKYDQSRRKLSV